MVNALRDRPDSISDGFRAAQRPGGEQLLPRGAGPAARCISPQISAVASGALSFSPSARDRRASCAATKTLSRSCSVAVMYMTLHHDERLSRPSVGAWDDGGAGGA